MKWYYDLTNDHRHSGDEESLLVWLCDSCAQSLLARHEVQVAGTDGFNDAPCWRCGARGRTDHGR